jgi:alpha-beta hydrolase superfamily lysophospholipase
MAAAIMEGPFYGKIQVKRWVRTSEMAVPSASRAGSNRKRSRKTLHTFPSRAALPLLVVTAQSDTRPFPSTVKRTRVVPSARARKASGG